MKPTLHKIKIVLVVSILLTILLACKKDNQNTPAKASNITVIDFNQPLQAPNFELNGLDGKRYSLKDLSGKNVVLHIATTWCPYCNAEAPHLQKLAENYQDVQILIIDVKESKDLVEERLVDHFGLTFPVLLDQDGTVAASFAPKDILPELKRDEVMLASYIVIDRTGNIRFMSLLDTKNFDSELRHIKEILNELD